MSVYVAPWIDLNVHLVWTGKTRYTHAHDFNDGRLSYYGLTLTETQIKSWFQSLKYADVINTKKYEIERTRMLVTLVLFDNTMWIDASNLRAVIDNQFRPQKHNAPPLPHVPPKFPITP